MKVVFRSGKAWGYEEVPKKVYQELLKSESIGSYIRENIIDCYLSYPIRR
ncbi:MAG: KTSC domain-containing protein [Deltaproteobacteria bacterium]|nr:KTSC domain-containing protein [Deltaproteobacteria bacterium]